MKPTKDSHDLHESKGLCFSWSTDSIWIVGLIVLALLPRLDYLLQPNFVLDADEAIVGLMAKHILEGKTLPVFYYGQHYMGSLEAFIAASFFWLWGISALTLKCVPLLFSILLVPIAYLSGLALGSRVAGRIAALLIAIPPATLLVWSSKARGGFVEVVVLGGLALLLTCHWLKEDHPGTTRVFLIGLVLGIAWWVNNQAIYFMLPIGCAVLSRLLQVCMLSIMQRVAQLFVFFIVGVIGWLLGGAPYWWYNLVNAGKSFGLFRLAEGSQIGDHLAGLFSTALPILLGAKRYWQSGEIFPYAIYSFGALYGALFVVLVLCRGVRLLSFPFLSIDRDKPVELFFWFVACAMLVFCLSSFGYLVQAPRYLLPLYLGIFVLVGYVLGELHRLNRYLSMSLVAVVLLGNVVSAYGFGRAIPGEPFMYGRDRIAKDNQPLIAWLKREGYTHVRTNYWLGYRLAFETHEEITFSVFQAPRQVRIAEYEQFVTPTKQHAVPLVLSPRQSQRIGELFDCVGVRYRRTALEDYVVLDRLHSGVTGLQPIAHEQYEVSASNRVEDVVTAIDGLIETRWGSGMPQKPGLWYRVRFQSDTILRGLRMSFGTWQHDYVRGLRIVGVKSDGKQTVLLQPATYRDLRYWLDGENDFEIALPEDSYRELRLESTASHPIYDWSIAELELLH